MKTVLMSIRPEWCEKIANGKKTIEVRKTRPKLKTPFKVYIYCTKDAKKQLYHSPDGFYCNNHASAAALNGKVIGEFVCDAIITDKTFGHDSMLYTAACMSAADIASYCTNAEMYGWHISDLKIYDRPEELCAVPPQSWYYVEGE